MLTTCKQDKYSYIINKLTTWIVQCALYNEEVRTVRELYLGFSYEILCPQLQIICNFLSSDFLEGTRTTIKLYNITFTAGYSSEFSLFKINVPQDEPTVLYES